METSAPYTTLMQKACPPPVLRQTWIKPGVCADAGLRSTTHVEPARVTESACRGLQQTYTPRCRSWRARGVVIDDRPAGTRFSALPGSPGSYDRFTLRARSRPR